MRLGFAAGFVLNHERTWKKKSESIFELRYKIFCKSRFLLFVEYVYRVYCSLLLLQIWHCLSMQNQRNKNTYASHTSYMYSNVRHQLAIVRLQSRQYCGTSVIWQASIAREMTIHFKSDQRQRCASNKRSTPFNMQIFNQTDVKIAILQPCHHHSTDQTNIFQTIETHEQLCASSR